MLYTKALPAGRDAFDAEISTKKEEWRMIARLTGPWLFALTVLLMLIIGGVSFLNAFKSKDQPFAGFLFYDYRMVGSFSGYHWPGVRAGLRYQDVILEVNSQPVSSGREIHSLLRQTPVGEKLTYLVARNGQTFTVHIPVSRFTLIDFVGTFLLPFLEGILFWMIGIIAYVLKRDTAVSWGFLSFCLFLGTYLVTGFAIQSVTYQPGSILVNILGLSFFPAAALHLSLLFPEKTSLVQKRPALQVFPYALSAVLMTLLLVNIGVLTGASLATREVIATAGRLQTTLLCSRFYILLVACSLAVSSFYVYRRSVSPIATQRARVMLLGAGLAFVPGTIVMTLVSSGLLAIPFNVFLLPVFIFPAAVAYAIVKHNLFDLDALVRRTYGYVLSTTAIVGVYAALVSILDLVFHSAEVSRSPLFSLAFALAIAFFFNPLRQRAQDWIDRLFYRASVNLRETSAQIINKLPRLLETDRIAKTLVEDVVIAMSLEHGCLFLLESETGAYTLHATAGDSISPVPPRQFTQHEAPVLALKDRTKPLFRHESKTHPRYESYREALQGTFRVLSVELIIPVRYQEELRGFAAFARKKSGRLFTVEDINLLTVISNAAAIALENASLFKENLEKRRLDKELETARDLQVGMLPDHTPTIPGFQLAARSIPARMIGGDFYDFLDVGETGECSQLGIVVGDGSGKSTSGALIMAAARSTLRAFAEAHLSAAAVLRLGNERLQRDFKEGSFVALVYAILDFQQRTLTLANAGQPSPIFCSSTHSAARLIETAGDRFPLGIVRDSLYQERCLSLQAGDVLVFYTDGVIEAMNANDELYGLEQFMASIVEGKGLDAEALTEKLLSDIERHVDGAEQHDDMILVVVKAL